ncbi:MAG: hypothetical protein AB7T06_20430 [Kofleriaceae bacterium]|jgi:hypothetical protein
MKKLIVALVIACVGLSARAARADVALGLFVGRPSGLDLKLDLQPRSSLDVLLGWTTFERGRATYGHLTYLFTIAAGRGRSVIIPLRIGIGAAVFGNSDHLDVGARVPFEIAFRFRATPLELYLEPALLLTATHGGDLSGQFGLGLRFYF